MNVCISMFLEHEYGGNGDDTSPSFFELFMQERMKSGFRPAMEYFVQNLYETHPTAPTLMLVKRFDEVFAAASFFLERYFLTRYDSLASEKFYGVKRVLYQVDKQQGSIPKTSTLSSKARNQTLFYAVFIPYLKAKLDNYQKKLSDEGIPEPNNVEEVTALTDVDQQEERKSDSDEKTAPFVVFIAKVTRKKFHLFLMHLKHLSLLHKLEKIFHKLYPFVHFSYEGIFFIYQWMYLFGDTPYFSPILKRMRVALVRVTANDLTNLQAAQKKYREELLKSLEGTGFLTSMRRSLLRISWATLDYSHVLLLLSIAGYKFLEWIYSEEGTAKMRSVAIDVPIPPPPVPPQFSGSALAVTADPRLCPLCRRQRTNPAISISGYVFCYPCIYHYVEEEGECPLTKIKCDVDSISKIYEDEVSITTKG